MEKLELENRVELARRSLTLISSIAARGAASASPENIGYALEELSQVLFERTGSQQTVFSPVPADQIAGLDKLIEELLVVDGFSSDMEALISNKARRAVGNQGTASSCLNQDRAAALLRPIIKHWIVELMDCGGTNIDATCDVVAEEEPELCKAVGTERLLSLCSELHRAEDFGRSEHYAARFYQLNRQYFGGQLEEYRVRAVFDASFWMDNTSGALERSYINLEERQIILGITHIVDSLYMDRLLIHHMAHASTGTTRDGDDTWRKEMNRLKEAGAEVSDWDVEPAVKYGR